MDGPRCADPFVYHRGVRCTRELSRVPLDLADKHPVLCLSTKHYVCKKCKNVLITTDPKASPKMYKKHDVFVTKKALKKAATTRVSRRRKIFTHGTMEEMKAIYNRCADPFLNHRGQRCTKDLTHIPAALINKHPILLLSSKDKLCQKCVNDFQIYPDDLDTLDQLAGLKKNSKRFSSTRARRSSGKKTKSKKSSKADSSLEETNREPTGEECADPLLRHKGKLCVKGLQRVTEDMISSHPLLLLTLHDKLCRACVKLLEARTKKQKQSSEEQFLYNYDSEISRQGQDSSSSEGSDSDSSDRSTDEENDSNSDNEEHQKDAHQTPMTYPQPNVPAVNFVPPLSTFNSTINQTLNYLPQEQTEVVVKTEDNHNREAMPVKREEDLEEAYEEEEDDDDNESDVSDGLLVDGGATTQEGVNNGFKILKFGIKDLVRRQQELETKRHEDHVLLPSDQQMSNMTSSTEAISNGIKNEETIIDGQVPAPENWEVVEEKGVDITQEQYIVYYDQDKEDNDFLQAPPDICANEELTTTGDNISMKETSHDLLYFNNKDNDTTAESLEDDHTLREKRSHNTSESEKFSKKLKRNKKKKKRSKSFSEEMDKRSPLLGKVGEKTYVCSECPYSTNSGDSLKFHHSTSHTDPKNTSRVHDPTCRTNLELSPEPVVDQSGEKKYVCPFCSFVTKRPDILKEHRFTHTGQKPYECTLCSHKCRTGGALRAHQRVHSSDRPFKCDYCAYSTKSQAHLRRHTLRHTEDRPMPFECPTCGKRFLSKCGMKSHQNFHFKDENLKCDKCNYSAESKDQLNKHKSQHVDSNDLVCRSCNITFKTTITLKKHLRNNICVKKFDCPLCSMTFSRKQEVRNHIKTHGKKPFRCNSCNYSCNTLELLESHTQQLHTQTNHYHCDSCPFSTWEKSRLDTHMRMIHGTHNTRTDDDDDVFVKHEYNDMSDDYLSKHFCKLCVPNRAYSTQELLINHIKVKHGVSSLPQECLSSEPRSHDGRSPKTKSKSRTEKLEFI